MDHNGTTKTLITLVQKHLVEGNLNSISIPHRTISLLFRVANFDKIRQAFTKQI